MKAKKLVIDLIEAVEINEENKDKFINILSLPLSAMTLYKKLLQVANKEGKGIIKVSELLPIEKNALINLHQKLNS